jgi:predicted LPLAT superfamily acyltransferase
VNQDWTTRPERGSAWSIRFIVWFALTFGRRASRVLLYPICFYFIIFSVQARAASRNYLNRALGRRAKFRDIFQHYFFFASTILDRIFLLNEQNTLLEIHVQGEEIFKEIISSGSGHFLAGAHMGSFEVLNSFGRNHGHLKTRMVMYEENARKLIAMLKNVNQERNTPVISLGKIDSMLEIREALENGEYIGILADRAISGEKMISCEFLGGQINLPAGPFRLAAILDRPMVLGLGLYQGGNRYNVYIEHLADLRHVPHSERDAAIEQAAQQFARRLEHYCRESPYNWFNFYDIWK